MESERLVENIRKMCSLNGISGYEQNVARALYNEFSNRYECYVDNFGNMSVKIQGKDSDKSLMLFAHMDEVGGVVNNILSNGMLTFHTVGGVDKTTLFSNRVSVENVKGAVCCVAAHIKDSVTDKSMYIDIGAKSADEASAMGVEIGTPITSDEPFVNLGNGRIMSKAIDDRAGCAILMEAIESIDYVPDYDIYFCFTVREETELGGAAMVADRIRPTMAIAVDTVPINDLYMVNSPMTIGNGPVFQLFEGSMTAFQCNTAHPGLVRELRKCAEEIGIKYQLCAEIGSWSTDADTVHRMASGVPTAYISLPRRNAHSASEIMDIYDAECSVLLIEKFIENLARVNLTFI